ncbi:MAG TPA: hypothetical protein PK890_07015 [Terrimesophilobacter sp.]|nr:hypothetical protein [Terrimesophilobacter sp.]
MPHTNNHKPTTYTEAFKRVEALAENAVKERLNRSTQLLCETETMRDPVERELAQARVLQNIAKTNATLETHQAQARFSKGS